MPILFAELFHSIRAQVVQVIFLVSAVFVISLLPSEGLVFPSIQDSSHTLVFFWASTILLKIWSSYDHNKSSWVQVASICLLAFLFGILIEFIQPYFGRNKSIIDAYNDFAGCSAAGLFFYRTQVNAILSKRLLAFTSMLFLLSGLIIPIENIKTLWQRNAAVPALVQFEAPWEQKIWQANEGAELNVVKGDGNNRLAEIRFHRGYQYPGISFHHIFGNWLGYSSLTFEVGYIQKKYLQKEELKLHFRIHDSDHNNEYDDRFNRVLTVKPGLNSFKMLLDDIKFGPKSRVLKLDKIESMSLFLIKPEQDVTLYVDSFLLH